MMKYLKYLAIVAGFMAMSPVHAKESWSPTEAELPMLPPYCTAKATADKQDDQQWVRIFGSDYLHLHHYCRGLVMFPRGFASRSARGKTEAFKEAINQFDYMIGHVSSNFVLLPEIYQNRGKALKLLNKPGEAITNLNKALELNRELVGAYTLLADIYEEQKNKTEALKHVTEALKYLPDSSGLKKRYQRLGGKLPYPDPYAKTDEAAPSVAPAAAQPAAEAEAATAEMQPAATTDAAASTNSNVGESSAQPASDTNPSSKRKNPWCRFCPD